MRISEVVKNIKQIFNCKRINCFSAGYVTLIFVQTNQYAYYFDSHYK